MKPMLDKLSVRDLGEQHLRGKRVVLRVDFNVPLDRYGRLVDDSRIRATLPTIEYLRGRGAAIVILSHLDRPKGVPDPKLSLQPAATRLAELLDRDVRFVHETVSEEALAASRELAVGEVLMLENTRFNPGETKNDPDFAKALAQLGDVYVNDAFGTAHRAHASNAGIARFLQPAAAGLLMERELQHLGGLLSDPERPFVIVLGGAKVSSKIDLIENMLGKVDGLCVGGAMACTFFRAMGLNVGRSLVDVECIDYARHILDVAGDALLLPTDVVVTEALEAGATGTVVSRDVIPDDRMVVDIGPDSASAFADRIIEARTILWNGPVGVFEVPPFDEGTRVVGQAVVMATAEGATSVVGGGDTAAAAAAQQITQHVSHISTGGGASLQLLAGEELPGVAALTDRKPQ